jgi:hypothetical protein
MKRTERPPPEFWAGFEQELRQKQLAALVERRSWWHGPAATFNRFGWLRLPFGATAVLAVTLVSIRHYSASDRYRDEPRGVVSGEKAALPTKTLKNLAEFKPVKSARAAPQSMTSDVEVIPKSSESGFVASDALRESSQQFAAPVRHGEELHDPAETSGFGPLVASPAIQLGSPGDVDSIPVEATAHLGGFEDRSISTLRPHRVAEALPTAVAVTEQRRSRLLAALGSAGTYTPEPSAPEHAKRSVIRYLAEDGWDRSISRLQADADRLSIRF